MAPAPPRVSFALPVYNGAATLARCLDSLLAQDRPDCEIVVCDNASTDATPEILRDYARRDQRVRPFFNETNLGQIENFNRVFHLSRGSYFRWIGSEDWLEPTYARRCADVLDRDSGAIAVTNYFRIHTPEGERYLEYTGELLESERPERRFARMVWTFHAGDALYEPIYCLIRRSVLERTQLIRMMTKADHMLAAELSLHGRFRHIRECLAHRWKPVGLYVHSKQALERYRPERAGALHASPWRLYRELLSIVWAHPLSRRQRLRCLVSALPFLVRETWRRSYRELRRFRRHTLGVRRDNLPWLRSRREDER